MARGIEIIERTSKTNSRRLLLFALPEAVTQFGRGTIRSFSTKLLQEEAVTGKFSFRAGLGKQAYFGCSLVT